MKEKIKKALYLKIIPVVAIKNANDTDGLADALIEGGLPCAEITFRTDAAAGAIEKLAKRNDMIVGAGTVLSIEHVRKAFNNGASFIVSPGFNPEIVRYCIEKDIPVIPGVCTPTEVEMALNEGLNIVKYFPAEALGGIKTLKAMSAPYQAMKYIPTGGIGPKNVVEYLSYPKVVACGGSWMVKSDMISNGRFSEITRLASEAVELSRKAGD